MGAQVGFGVIANDAQAVDRDGHRRQVQGRFRRLQVLGQRSDQVLRHQRLGILLQFFRQFGQVPRAHCVGRAARRAAQPETAQVGAFDDGIGAQAIAFMAQQLDMRMKGVEQAFQRLAAQAVQGVFELAVGLDEGLPGKIQHQLRHIVANHIALLFHAELLLLLAAGGEHGVEVVALPTAGLAEEVAYGLAAAKHLVDVVGRGEQRMNKRIVGEGVAVDVDRAGQVGDQAVAVAEGMLHRPGQVLLEAGGVLEHRVDQLGNAVQRPGDIGVEGRGGFEEIGNGGKEAHGVLVQMARPALAPFGRLMAVEIQSPMAASLARSMPVSMPNPSSR